MEDRNQRVKRISGQSGHRTSFRRMFKNGSTFAHRVSLHFSSYENSRPLNLDEVYGTMVRAAYLPNLVETQKAFQKSKQTLMKSNDYEFVNSTPVARSPGANEIDNVSLVSS